MHATSTPSRWTGPEAARIGQALGLRAAFFDVRSGCTGGLWALVQAARLAVDAQAPVLVTAADAFSLAFAPDERLLPLSMGDGAAALVLAPGVAGQGVVRACFTGLPEHADLATVPGELPPRDGASYVLAGDAMAFGAVAEEALARALEALAPPIGTRVVVQTGRADVARRVSRDAWLDGLRHHGNIGAPTALVALGELGPGMTAFVSAGGGLSSGALLWRDAGERGRVDERQVIGELGQAERHRGHDSRARAGHRLRTLVGEGPAAPRDARADRRRRAQLTDEPEAVIVRL